MRGQIVAVQPVGDVGGGAAAVDPIRGGSHGRPNIRAGPRQAVGQPPVGEVG